MSFVNSVPKPISMRPGSGGAFLFGRHGHRLENLEHASLGNKKARPVITLEPTFSSEQKEEALERLGFSTEARERIYHHFRTGRDGVLGGLSDGTVTLERIGFSKPEKGTLQPKFYLVVHDKKDEGGVNQFFHGYSRKGTPQAITTYKERVPIDSSAAEALSRRSNPCHETICRLKGHELGIKVSELGGESLYALDMTALSKRERWSLYMSLIWLLMNLHASGYVHGDIKQENIVVIRDDTGSIVGLRFIDLDTLAEEGGEGIMGGTIPFFSPDRMEELANYLEKGTMTADSKDDVWGVMGLICDLEWKVIETAPRRRDLALVDPRILRHWDKYSSIMMDEFAHLRQNPMPFILFVRDYFSKHPPTDESALFGGLSGGYLLDPVIMAMSRFKKEERPSAGELFEAYFQEVPEALEKEEGLDEEEILEPPSPPPKIAFWERIGRGFLRCLSYLFCCCFRDSRESQS